MTSEAVTGKRQPAAPSLRTWRLPTVQQMLAAFSLAGLIATGGVLATGASLRRSFLLPVSKPHTPRGLTGPLADGFGLTGAQFLMLLMLMGGFYVGFLIWGRHLSARWTIAGVGLLVFLFAIAPPLLSKDIFSYVAYARLGVEHGVDPYLHGPAVAPHDPIFRYVGWRHSPSAYGPFFTIVSYAFAPLGITGALWMLKALAAASALGCCALLWRCARLRGMDPSRAVALFGLNPLLLVYAVAGGHNDLLMMLLLVGGVALCLTRRPAFGAAGAVAAAFTKASAGIALPFFVLGSRPRSRALLGAAVAACAGIAVAIVAFPSHGVGVLKVLARETKFVSADSIPTELSRLFGASTVTPLAHVIFTGALVIGLIALIVWVWRGADWITGTGWAFVLTLVTSSWLLGWYMIWPLPFAALSRDRRLLAASLGLCAYFVFGRWNIFIGSG